MLKDKNILLCVSGGIAAYKIPNLASMLVKQGCNVNVIMTKSAENFITAKTFEALTGNPCITDTFQTTYPIAIHHIKLATEADYVMLAPATADIIGKLAHGIADDMITSTLLACRCPIAVAPSMNVNMYENPVVQDNIEILKKYGYRIIEPATGYMACRATGKGKMPEPAELFKHIEKELAYKKSLKGVNILVTAGATKERLDPVRYITNNSTGKMGYAIAKVAMLKGADVTLVTGHTALEDIAFVNTIKVESAEDMYNAVTANAQNADIIIKAAAVADYTPLTVADNKIKKSDSDMSIPLKRTKDILKELGTQKTEKQFICGFSMETENMLENSVKKLESKNIDMIVANNLKENGAGFGTDTNVITMITRNSLTELPIMSKEECAEKLLDKISELRNK
ncbi:MAG: bifunctional phosphopantothenoylcysteine decarboxylase/phosphopantothenate--cysteine ligase CoaBC [Acutalibacteraceae bacterium]|jgi:phosphopantothenoylcysteine decarboxylase/phosphopantothenate--cysteine ligase|nr:bifunctional phosphopantothenoylcysteine decarboxylase/phosphopantothenate--cysteine ligase CoaBC [Acutalibacteraceae bacterium]